MFTPSDFSSFISVVQNEYPVPGSMLVYSHQRVQKELQTLKDKVYSVLIGYADHNLTEFAQADGFDTFAQKLVLLLAKNNLHKMTREVTSTISEGESTLYYMLSTPGFFIQLNPNILSVNEDYDKKLSALVRAKCVLFLFENNENLNKPIPNEWFDAQEVHIRQAIGSDADWVKYNQWLNHSKKNKPVRVVNPAQVAAAAVLPPIQFENAVDEINPQNVLNEENSFVSKNDMSLFRLFKAGRAQERNLLSGPPRSFLDVLRLYVRGMLKYPRIEGIRKNISKGLKDYKNHLVVLKAQFSHMPRNLVQLFLLLRTMKNAWMAIFHSIVSTFDYAYGLMIGLAGVVLPTTLSLIVLDSVFNEVRIPGRRVFSFIVDLLETARELYVVYLITSCIQPILQVLTASKLSAAFLFVRGSFLVTTASFFVTSAPILGSLAIIVIQNPNMALLAMDVLDYISSGTVFAALSVMVGCAFMIQTALCAAVGTKVLFDKIYRSASIWAFGHDPMPAFGPSSELNIPQIEVVSKHTQLVGGVLTRLTQDFDNIPQESIVRLADDAHPLGELKNECTRFRGRALNNDQTVLNEPRVNQFVALYHEHHAKKTLRIF